MTYRRLTKDEILQLTTRIRYEDRLDMGAIRAGILDLFGPTAHKALLQWGSEYNDETNDLRITEIAVWDAAGKRLKREVAEDDYDEELSDFFTEVEAGECGDNDSIEDMVVYVKDTGGLDLPDLWAKETNP